MILIAIEIDKDFTPFNGWTDIPGLAVETADKINSGQWQAYGVGLMRTGDDGILRTDYSTFVWGAVCDAGFEGLYGDTYDIRNDHLRSLAEEQKEEHGDT